MKALILAAGRGSRLYELFQNTNKCMVEVNGKHVIEYSLDNAIATDVNEIIIVVGFKAEQIINHYGNKYKGRNIKYVLQWDQLGLVHAIECARGAINGEHFILMLGDEVLINSKCKNMLYEFTRGEVFVLCGVLRVENLNLIKRTYMILQDDNEKIYRLVEKPRNPLNDLMGTGVCVFNSSIFDYIKLTPIHHERQEKELPDLIQCAIDDGKIVKSYLVCDRYTNINTKDDIEMAEELLFQSHRNNVN